jgi:hypothetical protein
MFRRVLLLGGVLSSLLYVFGIDLVAPVRYPVYHDYADQMVSELFAAGAPTRTLMVWLMIPYNVLVLGLALGVWKSAERSRAARWTAAVVVFGIWAGVLARPMPRATPGLGIAERVNIYATMLWIATLAASFLRLPTHPGSASRC